MFFNKTDDGAVSPVVGVILMVAVTVILAAVIGSFVLDLGSNVSANPSAGVTFDQAPDGNTGFNVDIQAISMENADSLTVQYASGNNGTVATTFNDPTNVGDVAEVDNANSGETITVIGSLDGKEAVLQTYTVEG